MNNDVRQTTPGLLDESAEILAEAFTDYPLFTRALRNPARRTASLPLMWLACARQFEHLPESRIELAHRDGRAVGAAIWAEGTRMGIGWREVIRTGQVRFGLRAGVRDALVLMRLQASADAMHRSLVSEPHLYLLGLGVRQGHQHQGIGTELLRRCLAHADELGWPVYLETNLEANVRLYRRVGFLVVGQDAEPGLDTWYMLRPAR